MSLRRLIILAMSVTILFVQEQALMFIPNVQFTVALLVVYASIFTYRENLVLIFVYVILDNLYMGTFNPFYLMPMLIAWSLIPTAYHTILRRTTHEKKLAFFGLFFGFIYGWVFIPFHMIQTGIHTWWPYLLADLPFEIVMATSGFLTILWTYRPLHNLMRTEMAKLELQFDTVYTIAKK